jgi:hypothetical protein
MSTAVGTATGAAPTVRARNMRRDLAWCRPCNSCPRWPHLPVAAICAPGMHLGRAAAQAAARRALAEAERLPVVAPTLPRTLHPTAPSRSASCLAAALLQGLPPPRRGLTQSATAVAAEAARRCQRRWPWWGGVPSRWMCRRGGPALGHPAPAQAPEMCIGCHRELRRRRVDCGSRLPPAARDCRAKGPATSMPPPMANCSWSRPRRERTGACCGANVPMPTWNV